MKEWTCLYCGFVYEEEKGLPEQGIPPGTPFEDLPEDWVCPDCDSGKSEFFES